MWNPAPASNRIGLPHLIVLMIKALWNKCNRDYFFPYIFKFLLAIMVVHKSALKKIESQYMLRNLIISFFYWFISLTITSSLFPCIWELCFNSLIYLLTLQNLLGRRTRLPCKTPLWAISFLCYSGPGKVDTSGNKCILIMWIVDRFGHLEVLYQEKKKGNLKVLVMTLWHYVSISVLNRKTQEWVT